MRDFAESEYACRISIRMTDWCQARELLFLIISYESCICKMILRPKFFSATVLLSTLSSNRHSIWTQSRAKEYANVLLWKHALTPRWTQLARSFSPPKTRNFNQSSSISRQSGIFLHSPCYSATRPQSTLHSLRSVPRIFAECWWVVDVYILALDDGVQVSLVFACLGFSVRDRSFSAVCSDGDR